MLDSDLKILDTLTLRQALTAEKAKEIENEITAKGVNLENFLLENKIVNEEQITEVKAQIAGMPYFNLLEKEVPEAILNFLPEEIAQTYKIICFAKEGREIKIGMVEPNLKAMEAVNFLAAEGKFKVEYYIISVSSFKKTFKQYQKIEEEISSALQVKAEEDGDELIEVDSSIDNISSDEINSA
ncbi:hypothetical protein EOL99_02890, partial [Candidatus Falkowbacteria bacterium]|nr:hypothetical protein [Candidatus Falkowbacteria bacterium]